MAVPTLEQIEAWLNVAKRVKWRMGEDAPLPQREVEDLTLLVPYLVEQVIEAWATARGWERAFEDISGQLLSTGSVPIH